jgi:hypothetical protein
MGKFRKSDGPEHWSLINEHLHLKNYKRKLALPFFMRVYLIYEISSPNISKKQIHPNRNCFYGLLSVSR